MDSCILRVYRVSMGTEFQALVAGADPEYLRAAAHEALDEVERLEARLSHYRADSEICDLNQRAAYGPVRLEPSLFALLARALALGAATGGAFDCTAGALIRCWGFFRGQGRMAEPEAVAEARERVGGHLVEMDAGERTVRFLRDGVQVHLGAIGKGYAVDLALQTLRALRVPAALVHGGTSTLAAYGSPPGADGWVVGLRDPRRAERRVGRVRIREGALSTSGDYEQFFEAEGRRYSHILDPRTGYPAAGMRSATFLAASAADTDALSTAAFVLGVDGARRICDTFPGTAAVLIPEPGPGAAPETDPTVVVLGDVDLTLADDLDQDEE